MYLINAGVFVHAPHHTILEGVLQHKDSFAFDSASGESFLQAFINHNRERSFSPRLALAASGASVLGSLHVPMH